MNPKSILWPLIVAGIVCGVPVRAETLTIPGGCWCPVSSAPLLPGVSYLIEASGTYSNFKYYPKAFADAEFHTAADVWRELYTEPEITETNDILDLLVDGASINWLGSADGGANWLPHTFSPNHVYRTHLVGSGAPVSFGIADWGPFGNQYYVDNEGSLTVNISPIASMEVIANQGVGGSVDISYRFPGAGFSNETVTLLASTNRGATFDILPAPDSLSGIAGCESGGGWRKLTWNAARTLPTPLFKPNTTIQVTANVNGSKITGTSQTFLLDLENRSVSVSGRVLEALNRTPVAGATVTLAGQSTTTSSDGRFAFSGTTFSSGNSLAVTKAGFMSHAEPLVPESGSDVWTLEDTLLQCPAPLGTPKVTKVRPKYEGLFLSGASFFNEYAANVNWNGTTPGRVEFSVNGGRPQVISTSSSEATAQIDMGLGFAPSLTLGANNIYVTAVSSGGQRSDPFPQNVTILPAPPLFDLFTLPFELLDRSADAGFLFKLQVPPTAFQAAAIMPIRWFDKVGLDLASVTEVKYVLHSGEWTFRTGARGGSPKLSWGGWRANIECTPEARGIASQTRGWEVDEVGLKLRLDAKYPILTVYVFDVLPGGQILRVMDALVIVGVDINSIQRLKVNGLFRFDADMLWSYHGMEFKEAVLAPGGGLQALYAPRLFGSSLEVDLTGRLNFPWKLNPPMAWKVAGEVSFGLRAVVWGIVLTDNRWILLTGDIATFGSWPERQRALLRTLAPDGSLLSVEATLLSTTNKCPRPVERHYLGTGPERFVAHPAQTKSNGAETAATLDNFRLLSCTPARGSVMADANSLRPLLHPGRRIKGTEGATCGTNQADCVLVQNTFPNAEPCLAVHSNELILLYVSDNETGKDLQFTDIKWTRWDGADWSEPLAIDTNTQAEFAPQVAFDGKGDAIAAWERVADPNFTNVDLTAMAAQMEIVWSRWDRTNGVWSEPEALTSNDYLDHAPLLCGPMADGSVLLVWTRNQANLLMGTNAPGQDQVLWAAWDPDGQHWSIPTNLLADLPYRLSQSLSGTSNYAVYAWSRDLDGNLADNADQELFCTEFVHGAWRPPQRLTTNSVADGKVRLAVSPELYPALAITEEDFESGDFSSLPWVLAGETNWHVTDRVIMNAGRASSYAATTGIKTNQGIAQFWLDDLDCPANTSLSFWVRADYQMGIDYMNLMVDNDYDQQYIWQVGTNWTQFDISLSAGFHTVAFEYYAWDLPLGQSNQVWIDDVVIPGVLEEGFEEGYFPFRGYGRWTVTNTIVRPLVPPSGTFAAATGDLMDHQHSSLTVATNCADGIVSFAFKLTSDAVNTLAFKVDGAVWGTWSDTPNWTTVSFPVAAGRHQFEWVYSEIWGFPDDFFQAFLDNVRLPTAESKNATFTLWQQGTNLVMNSKPGADTTMVRVDSQTAGFADYAMTIGPLGHLVLLWQEMSTNGSDAHYMVYDPVADTWSRDSLLCADPPLERSFAPVWDDMGNLTVAYNKVQMFYTNKSVELEGGEMITITNVPQPGRVDLVVTKRALVKDLALLAGDFTLQGVNYLPGDPLTLSATVRNVGNIGVSNLMVSFFDGNPKASGTLITNVTLPGWLEAAATNVATASWVVPEPPSSHTVFAVVNPANMGTEYDESNNVQSLRIGGSDLMVTLVSQAAETNGALRVIVQVQNWGASTATNSILAIRREGETSAPLAEVDVPVLVAGRLARLALDLPPGTQPEGETVYRLFADETRVVNDVDTNNNTTAFAVNLWLDTDGDGMPNGWMTNYFGHATGLESDLSRAQDDFDGDGANNLAEYQAGTNPRDPASYLRIDSFTGGGTNGVRVAWGSVSNRLYSVQRAGSLIEGDSNFTNLAQHILSTPPQNIYLDVTVTNAAQVYYRIKVE
jgi:hypothetical protein